MVRLVGHNTRKPIINRYMFQFLYGAIGGYLPYNVVCAPRSFNSYMVRLVVMMYMQKYLSAKCFNSYMVRLVVSSILAKALFNSRFNSYMVRLVGICFPALCGQLGRFNSYMVRLVGLAG